MTIRVPAPDVPPHQDQAWRNAAAETLAGLWANAGSGPAFCAPGCSCGAGMLFSLGVADIEADVMAFLQTRFTAGADPAIARVLESRAAAASLAPTSFGLWLMGLAEAPLSAEEFDRLADALSTVMQSLSGEDAGPQSASRFTCT